MLRVTACSRFYGFCHLHAGIFSNVVIPYLLIKRIFASYTPNSEKTQTALPDKEVEVQKPHTTEQQSSNRLFEEVDTEKIREEILSRLNKRGLTVEGRMCKGPVPDGLDLLGWNIIEQERIERNMLPERRKQIEKLSTKGDPLSQLRLQQIKAYEKRYACHNDQ